ncbi:MAG: galactose oxidase [Bacteroides sp.]|nr:galactose oxidase [Bacteroides sp.]
MIIALCGAMTGCTNDDTYTLGKWYKRSAFPGEARYEAASFCIGNIGYIYGGYNGVDRFNSLWSYDMQNNYWTPLADIPNRKARNGAVGFAINGKGYITGGYDGVNYLDETWEYDPDSDTWTQVDNLPQGGLQDMLSFSLGNYGFVGTGYDGKNTQKYFYKFDATAPAGSQWEIDYYYPGEKRRGGLAFVIGDAAYIGFGQDNNSLQDDFYKFTLEDGWEQLRDIANTSDDDYDDDYDMIRKNAVAFSIDGLGYVVTGTSGSYRSDYWIYDPTTDLWRKQDERGKIDITPFEGSSREHAVSFSNGQRGFVATGNSSSYALDDIWELKPYEYEED